jgi:hypothetical protein
MIKGVWESVSWGPHSHEGLGANKGNYRVLCGLLKWEGELVGGMWFCMGNGVEIKFVVAHDKTNSRWERLGLWWHMIKQMVDGND